MAWAPLPTFDYNSHIRRNVGDEGLQGRWGRQGWSAAIHMCNPNHMQYFLGGDMYQQNLRTHKKMSTGGPIFPRRDRYFPPSKNAIAGDGDGDGDGDP